jgi:hypothetical protein
MRDAIIWATSVGCSLCEGLMESWRSVEAGINRTPGIGESQNGVKKAQLFVDKAGPDWHATALNFSFSHCKSLLNFLGEFLECIEKWNACHSGQTLQELFVWFFSCRMHSKVESQIECRPALTCPSAFQQEIKREFMF